MALSPMPRDVCAPQHFSAAHPLPNHPLIHYFDDRGYTCHVCNTDGFGARFQCQACPVSIHVYCSDCPAELPCFFHSHSMFRVPPTHPPRNCALCREPINGLSYRCHYCNFDVHPLCTQFPRELRHVIDSNHNLRLQQVQSGSCSICRNDCSSSWVYGCGVCRFNIHPQCLRRQYDSGGSGGSQRMIPHAPSRWTSFIQQPAFHGPAPAHPYHHYGPPGQYPICHFWYPGPPATANFPLLPTPGPVWYHHNPPPPPPPPQPPLRWGSQFQNSIFSLIGNLAAGAVTEFVFGSIGF